MRTLPNLEQKTIRVTQNTDELFKVDFLEDLAIELDQLARCVNQCGNDATLMKQEVSRRVRDMQDFLYRTKRWE